VPPSRPERYERAPRKAGDGPNGAALFEAANKLRGSVESAEYKHLVLGLLFLKYISDAFEQRRGELEAELCDPSSDVLEDRDEYAALELEERSRELLDQQVRGLSTSRCRRCRRSRCTTRPTARRRSSAPSRPGTLGAKGRSARSEFVTSP
jgi:HsdM N-terminal domain